VLLPKNTFRNVGENSLPSSLRCQAPNSMHNQADLSPIRRVVHWTKNMEQQKNKKNIQVSSKHEEHAISIDLFANCGE